LGKRSKQLNEPIDIASYKHKEYHQRIIDLYKDKTPINRIATITGLSRATIKRHLKAAGIYKYNNNNIILNIKDNNIKEDIIPKKINSKEDIYQDKDKVISSKIDKTNTSSITNNDTKQLNKLDSIINRLLAILDRKSVLVDLTTTQQVKALDQLVSKKVQLKDIANPNKHSNQVIFNFINSREFSKELKAMQQVKDKAIDVTAVE
jgi:uncharacterized protein YerC